MNSTINPQWVYRDQVLNRLKDRCRAHPGGQKGWATENGFSPQFVNDMLKEHREISEKAGYALGLQRMVVFYEVKFIK